MQKEMNTSTMESHFSLPLVFCKAVGLREPRTITPKTSTSSTGSWQARLAPYSNCSHLLGSGWTRFCRENGIKAGDVCTFKLVETTLWHVIITRR
uniref:TF-B3 domain-containing protein n=1 Tax=Arundo donax TaxID=35708 RepID=A0A0A9AT18_ARUDO